MPAVVIDQRLPVAMDAAARIGVLVQMGAVETGEGLRIRREMSGHPVEQYAQTGGVATCDESGEIGWRAMTCGRRIQAGRLIAPRAIERMLGHRQQFNVGEAEGADIGDPLIGEFGPGQKSAVGAAPPRTDMYFIDRTWPAVPPRSPAAAAGSRSSPWPDATRQQTRPGRPCVITVRRWHRAIQTCSGCRR